MPAWTYNLLFVSGPEDAVQAFESAAKEEELGLDFSFRALLPPPSSATISGEERHEWALLNYGNKMGSGAAVLAGLRPNLRMYYFLSPWNQSNFHPISLLHPKLQLDVVYYRESGPEAMGMEILHNGEHLFSTEEEDFSNLRLAWKPYYAAGLEEYYLRQIASLLAQPGAAPMATIGHALSAITRQRLRAYFSAPSNAGRPDLDRDANAFNEIFALELQRLLIGAAKRKHSFISPVEKLSHILENVAAYGLRKDATFFSQLTEAMVSTRIARLKDCLKTIDSLQLKASELEGAEIAISLVPEDEFSFFHRAEFNGFLDSILLAEVDVLEAQILQRTTQNASPDCRSQLQQAVQKGTIAEFVRRSLRITSALHERLKTIDSNSSIGTLSWRVLDAFEHEEIAHLLNEMQYPLEDELVEMLGKTDAGQYSDGWPF